ncbi:MAG: uracil-DNA glycosylase [bacterium]|nr:uracil-DNA glycosylase [bacterium]
MSDELTALITSLETHLRIAKKLGVESFTQFAEFDGQTLVKSEDRAEVTLPTMRTLADIAADIARCTKCPLYKTRKNTVPGEGNPRAKLVFVGEAPGEDEDVQGRPFVGRAGQLLTQMIEAEKSLNVKRTEVFICNVLKCRPPGNRNPLPEEIACCEPYLKAQLAIIQPKLICALGTFAAQTLLRTESKISQLRGKFYTYEGIPVLPTFHPSYLLRNPSSKYDAWQDMLLLRAEYERVNK